MPSISYASDKHQEHSHGHEHEHEHNNNEIEKIQVRASRLGRIVTESATKTEIINAEEIQEKALMRPGNISMLVAETGGVRVQTTSPSLGSANIRLQGLFGRYTQLLSDGLPLYGGQTASIGLLQIPPTDLANVEIIKGSASSLYGGSALGGVINLISKTPSREAGGDVLFNATSKNGQDLTAYYSAPVNDQVSASITSGLHHQKIQDFDDDGWADMAGYERGTVRPRLYWESDSGANLYMTIGFMKERRQAGTLDGEKLPDQSTYGLNQNTVRTDVGFVFDQSLGDTANINFRGSAMNQEHEHYFGTVFEEDKHQSYLFESSVSGYSDDIAWLIGAAFQQEKFRSFTFDDFDYSYQVPGVFSQVDYEANEELSMSLSARTDRHSEYGTQISPRISLLYKPEHWILRAAYGQGYYAPSPFIEDIDEVGLSRVAPLDELAEERASTASIDISYLAGDLETSITLFASDIDNVTELVNTDGNVQKPVMITNAAGESQIRGTELLLRYRWHDIKLTGSYLFTDATKGNGLSMQPTAIALTPKHSAGFVAMWEEHGSHLVGFEAYYTGTQHLENNPYRDKSDAYWHLGLLGQITIGCISWFLNAENLLDVRQTKEESLLLPQQSASGRWTTDIWSRNDGFTINAGFRVSLGD